MNQNEKPKRKTHTSSEVKMRYNNKTYVNFVLHCRQDSDTDVIDAINTLRAGGIGTTEAILTLIRKGLEK